MFIYIKHLYSKTQKIILHILIVLIIFALLNQNRFDMLIKKTFKTTNNKNIYT